MNYILIGLSILSCSKLYACVGDFDTWALTDHLGNSFPNQSVYPFRLDLVGPGYDAPIYITERDDHLENLVTVNSNKAYDKLRDSQAEQQVVIGQFTATVAMFTDNYEPLVRWEFVKEDGCWKNSALIFDVDVEDIDELLEQ
jgi:hypothetical protein